MMVHDPDVPLPSPGSAQGVRSPGSLVRSGRWDSLMPVSLLFVAFACAIPRQHTGWISLPTPPCAFDAWGPELVDPATPARDNPRGDIRGSQVPVEPPLSVCPCSRDLGRTGISDHGETPVLPPLIQRRRLRRPYCRGSVAWIANSLSTPRGAGYPYPTQDSLPAAGQALPDGTSTRKGSAERSPSQLLIDIPLSRASWRNEGLPLQDTGHAQRGVNVFTRNTCVNRCDPCDNSPCPRSTDEPVLFRGAQPIHGYDGERPPAC
jgi:hypothetical protein